MSSAAAGASHSHSRSVSPPLPVAAQPNPDSLAFQTCCCWRLCSAEEARTRSLEAGSACLSLPSLLRPPELAAEPSSRLAASASAETSITRLFYRLYIDRGLSHVFSTVSSASSRTRFCAFLLFFFFFFFCCFC